MRRSLISYIATEFPDHTFFYARVGPCGVYVISDRDRRQALMMRHYDEHHCPGGLAHCPEGKRLWDNMHPDDRVVVGYG